MLAPAEPAAAAVRLADVDLLKEIQSIPAIDNHAHPVRPTSAGEAPDNDYDALPVDNLEAQSDPVRLRENAPELAEARRTVSAASRPKFWTSSALESCWRIE